VATTTLGQAMIAATQGTRLAVPQLYAGLGALSAEVAARAARLIPHFAEISAGGFALATELCVAALEAKLAQRPSPAL
jgi:hypothetical protein